MQRTYDYEEFEYAPSPEELSGQSTRYPVVVVGAGPVGLTAANDLVYHGIPVVVIDEDNKVSLGSRAICFAKRTLEVFDRLGCVEPMEEKGVTWNVGRVFYRDKEAYQFNLLPEEGHGHPAFINLQQYYLEEYLIEPLRDNPLAELRWLNRLVDLETHDDFVRLTVATPRGMYQMEAEWLIAADGTRSTVRKLMGLDYKGKQFEGKFLITDVVMKNEDFPTERWFWFDPPFNPGYSALLHKQADNVWRIDMQLGRDVDVEEEKDPNRVLPRIRAMLGEDADFDLEWISIYRFHSRRMERFVHGRVFFVGDAAHIVSPFGARGANSGIQDVDNLIWKLKLVMEGKASPQLLETYNEERIYAANENLFHTETSTEFISPNTPGQKALRNAVLELSREYEFARPLINSGRLSTATIMPDSPLNTPDEDEWNCRLIPGAPAEDAPVVRGDERSYFLKQVGGVFNGVLFVDSPQAIPTDTLADLQALAQKDVPIETKIVALEPTEATEYEGLPVFYDADGYMKQRYDATPGAYYLLRPDQHVCARWRSFDRAKVEAAQKKAGYLL
ncbi:MAG: FAD-dependent oxidoreductase [Chloroflexi bacterium]|nr:FAD-dependent oxidoreductase [Chloroflexota bacterium]